MKSKARTRKQEVSQPKVQSENPVVWDRRAVGTRKKQARRVGLGWAMRRDETNLKDEFDLRRRPVKQQDPREPGPIYKSTSESGEKGSAIRSFVSSKRRVKTEGNVKLSAHSPRLDMLENRINRLSTSLVRFQ